MGAPDLRPALPLIVWMIAGWLFLGGLLSSMARFRFTNRFRVCDNVTLPIETFSLNGDQCLNCLCQARGQAHLQPHPLARSL
jgi:hypothetical protein